jgi:aryl-alcohol dehydrogenase-like predicted oxidoreductase
MEYTKLGRTGLDVSRMCLGCMSYGEGDRGKRQSSTISKTPLPR